MKLKLKYQAESADDLQILAAMLSAASTTAQRLVPAPTTAIEQPEPLVAAEVATPELAKEEDAPKKRRSSQKAEKETAEVLPPPASVAPEVSPAVTESAEETAPAVSAATEEAPETISTERVTLEMVRLKVTELASNGKRDAALAILKEFLPDAEPRVTNLQESQYADFYAKLLAL